MLPGGDDWTIQRSDGVIELDLRITLETDDGALIHMTFEGIRDDGAAGLASVLLKRVQEGRGCRPHQSGATCLDYYR